MQSLKNNGGKLESENNKEQKGKEEKDCGVGNLGFKLEGGINLCLDQDCVIDCLGKKESKLGEFNKGIKVNKISEVRV